MSSVWFSNRPPGVLLNSKPVSVGLKSHFNKSAEDIYQESHGSCIADINNNNNNTVRDRVAPMW